MKYIKELKYKISVANFLPNKKKCMCRPEKKYNAIYRKISLLFYNNNYK